MFTKLISFLSILFLLATVIPSEAKEKKKKEKNKTKVSVKTVNKDDKYRQIALFSKVLHLLEDQYVQPLDMEKVLQGAIKGMLSSLDPHSGFLNKEAYRRMKNDTSGRFGGIGVEIWLADDGLLTILHPIEGAPAWKAGVMPYDKIIKINDEPTKGLTLIEAVTKMQGKTGESLKLTIYRERTNEVKDFEIRRTIIDIKSVAYQRIAEDYGYIRLNHFQEKSSKEIKKALNRLEKKAPMKGLILDLRNNPGGLLDEAVEVTNLFIDNGVIVSTMGRDKKNKEVRVARSGLARKDIPLAVLVNGNSASAAEIVAGALKDHNRALILGSKTFGKGSVQTLIPLENGLGLRLTIALYYTPSGISIQEEGVAPHIYLDDMDLDKFNNAKKGDNYTRESGLQKFFRLGKNIANKSSKKIKGLPDKKDKKSEKINPKDDYQVQQALSYLKSYDLFDKMKKIQMGTPSKNKNEDKGKDKPKPSS